MFNKAAAHLLGCCFAFEYRIEPENTTFTYGKQKHAASYSLITGDRIAGNYESVFIQDNRCTDILALTKYVYIYILLMQADYL